MKTKHGYLKDGFVIDDDNDYNSDEDIENTIIDEDNDDYNSDDDSGSELAEEEI